MVALRDLREPPLGRERRCRRPGRRPDPANAARWTASISARQILQFAVGLAQHGHAREVADIAVIIAAGIERQHVALLPALRRRRPVVAAAAGEQAVFEGQAAIGLRDAAARPTLRLVVPGPCPAITSSIDRSRVRRPS